MRWLIAAVFLFCSCNIIEPESKDRTIIYTISGTAPSVDITMSNAGGGTEQFSGVSIPWSRTFGAKKDDFLYISAQNNGDAGSVSVEIFVNGSKIKSAFSSGAYVIATASGTAP